MTISHRSEIRAASNPSAHGLPRWMAAVLTVAAVALSTVTLAQTTMPRPATPGPSAAPRQALPQPAAPAQPIAPGQAAAAQSQSSSMQAGLSGQSRDTLGEGDTVRITVFQNPDLTTDARVSENGTITFPMIGVVPVGGLTPSAAEARIAQQLEQGKFVIKPQVNLNVTKVRSRQVTVLGQVARPGRYALEDPTSGVMEVLALAGGVVPTADDTVIVVTNRGGNTQRQEVNVEGMLRTGDLKSNVQLANGDTIYVQRAPVFYIYGEVQRAGSYRLTPPMTVVQAIATGGGITPRGTERGLKVRRKGPNGSIQTIDVGLNDSLVADDVVYVKESLF